MEKEWENKVGGKSEIFHWVSNYPTIVCLELFNYDKHLPSLRMNQRIKLMFKPLLY